MLFSFGRLSVPHIQNVTALTKRLKQYRVNLAVEDSNFVRLENDYDRAMNITVHSVGGALVRLLINRRPAGGGFCHMPHDQSKPFAGPGRIRQ